MPKAPPKNGYYYFMIDFKSREEKLGRRFTGGMKEVADAAAEEWKNLPQREKDDYNQYAKDHRKDEERRNVQKSLEKKFNSQGVSFAELERRKEEQAKKVRDIENFIKTFVQALDIDGVKYKQFCLIHVNIFCKTDDEIYYPAELAISKFSLAEGIIDAYHTFMDPGEIKTGYSFAVREHSDKFHKITLQFVKQDEKLRDMSKIYNDICKFLELDSLKSVPLFTMYDDVFQNTSFTAVEKTLSELWQFYYGSKNSDDWKKFFPVYPLSMLFHKLKNRCYEVIGDTQVPFPNSSLAIAELNKDNHIFKDEYACKFHQEVDAVRYCSSSYVKRWAQIIRDHCCLPLNVEWSDALDTSAPPSENASTMLTCADDDVYIGGGGGGDDDDKDDYTDCRSVYSEMSSVSARSAKTAMSEASVSFASVSARSNSASHPGQSKSSSVVWNGKAPAQKKSVPSFDNDNFPALSGMGRGLRKLNLNQ